MTEQTKNPFVVWRDSNPHDSVSSETNMRVWQWQKVTSELLALFDLFDDEIEPWLKGSVSKEPDLVAFIAGYGYTRTATGDWKELPIDIPDGELADWKENSGLIVTIGELRDWQAGVAGSVAEILHARLDESVTLIRAQLRGRYDELARLASRQLTDFTPTQWSDDDLFEEEAGHEIKDLDRIFDLYEELWCFEQGIEELRMIMITEDDPDFHLPSKEFYDELMSIRSHELMVALANAEPKMRKILKLWSETIMDYSGKPYHRPYDETAPEVFWWRHSKAHHRPRRKG